MRSSKIQTMMDQLLMNYQGSHIPAVQAIENYTDKLCKTFASQCQSNRCSEENMINALGFFIKNPPEYMPKIKDLISKALAYKKATVTVKSKCSECDNTGILSIVHKTTRTTYSIACICSNAVKYNNLADRYDKNEYVLFNSPEHFALDGYDGNFLNNIYPIITTIIQKYRDKDKAMISKFYEFLLSAKFKNKTTSECIELMDNYAKSI